jgi:hypothetical protein
MARAAQRLERTVRLVTAEHDRLRSLRCAAPIRSRARASHRVARVVSSSASASAGGDGGDSDPPGPSAPRLIAVQGEREGDYLVVDRCPFCGRRHRYVWQRGIVLAGWVRRSHCDRPDQRAWFWLAPANMNGGAR